MKDMKVQFQTPDKIVDYMISLIPKDYRTILEPTPGLGNIVSKMKKFKVTAPKDFFLLKPGGKWDAVIMNPPFSSAYADLTNAPHDFSRRGMNLGYHILTECMNLSDHVIAHMPWFTVINADKRLRFLKNYGIVSITAVPRSAYRHSRIQTCIIQLKKGYRGKTIFDFFD